MRPTAGSQLSANAEGAAIIECNLTVSRKMGAYQYEKILLKTDLNLRGDYT